jgi:DeoR family transcriptional regulator of aga operon
MKKRTTVQRRTAILEKLNIHGKVDVSALSEEMSVSEVTIRNDLTQLEMKNLLVRVQGGAIKPRLTAMDFHLSEKQKQNYQEKKAIGKKAAELIAEGDTIIIDSGTTTMEITKHIPALKNLTVITNALNIASSLVQNHKNLHIIMPGGFLRENSMSMVGTPAEESLRHYFCDKVFLGVDGFDTRHGLSTPNVEEAHLNRVMIDVARQVVVVADSSKFQRKSFAFIAPVSVVHTVITDSGIAAEDLKRLQEAGIEVIIAD